ncbi:hypothetical protein WN53_04000 [Serratia fonticola]|nr:hypothetical protein WN53_04000 [Serratia fonticola]
MSQPPSKSCKRHKTLSFSAYLQGDGAFATVTKGKTQSGCGLHFSWPVIGYVIIGITYIGYSHPMFGGDSVKDDLPYK